MTDEDKFYLSICVIVILLICLIMSVRGNIDAAAIISESNKTIGDYKKQVEHYRSAAVMPTEFKDVFRTPTGQLVVVNPIDLEQLKQDQPLKVK